MNTASTVIGVVIGVPVVALGTVLVIFNLKRFGIIRRARQISDQELDSIYELVEAYGSEPAEGCLLARVNKPAPNSKNVISIPKWIPDFPWAGQEVVVDVGDELSLHVGGKAHSDSCLGGKTFRAVRIPRTKRSGGTAINNYSPKVLVAPNSTLAEQLRKLCPKYPQEFLSYLLCAGGDTFEFEPINQVRIATGLAWAQPGHIPTCSQCKQRMSFIVQVPGDALQLKDFSEGTYYLFGCKKHLEQTRTITQYT